MTCPTEFGATITRTTAHAFRSNKNENGFIATTLRLGHLMSSRLQRLWDCVSWQCFEKSATATNNFQATMGLAHSSVRKLFSKAKADVQDVRSIGEIGLEPVICGDARGRK